MKSIEVNFLKSREPIKLYYNKTHTLPNLNRSSTFYDRENDTRINRKQIDGIRDGVRAFNPFRSVYTCSPNNITAVIECPSSYSLTCF